MIQQPIINLNKILKGVFPLVFFLVTAVTVTGQQIPIPSDWPKDQVPESIWIEFQNLKPGHERALYERMERYRNIQNPYVQYMFGVLACRLQPDCPYNGQRFLKRVEDNVKSPGELMRMAKVQNDHCG